MLQFDMLKLFLMLQAGKTYPVKFVNRRFQFLKNETELTLTDRMYICKVCGMVKNRDRHAAENLHRAGLARIYACGHDGSVSEPRVYGATSMDEAGSQSVCNHIYTHLAEQRFNT